MKGPAMAEPRRKSTPGKVTARDVARRARVSQWTVSRAFTQGAYISPGSLERVRRAAEKLGYRPNLLARSLRTKHTHIVGLAIDELANPNMLLVLDEATRQLQARGYTGMLLNLAGEQRQGPALSLADQLQVDAVIFLGTILTPDLLRLALEIRNVPLIVLLGNSDNPDLQVVSTDGPRGGRELAGLLADQGHRRFGYMGGPPAATAALRRSEGFREGLAARGLALGAVVEAGHYARESGYQAMLRYLEATPAADRAEAMFCENDILAIGAMDALHDRGARMAVVGYDGIELGASTRYDLTTCQEPLELLVQEVVARVVAPGEERPKRLLARAELAVRTSHLRRP
jgi:DNA-binding LacI/PurR family transcriptional regulator